MGKKKGIKNQGSEQQSQVGSGPSQGPSTAPSQGPSTASQHSDSQRQAQQREQGERFPPGTGPPSQQPGPRPQYTEHGRGPQQRTGYSPQQYGRGQQQRTEYSSQQHERGPQQRTGYSPQQYGRGQQQRTGYSPQQYGRGPQQRTEYSSQQHERGPQQRTGYSPQQQYPQSQYGHVPEQQPGVQPQYAGQGAQRKTWQTAPQGFPAAQYAQQSEVEKKPRQTKDQPAWKKQPELSVPGPSAEPQFPTLLPTQSTPVQSQPEGSKKSKKKGKTTEQLEPAKSDKEAVPEGKKIVKEMMKTTSSIQIPRRQSKNIIHNEKYIMRRLTIEVNYLPIKIKNPQLRIYHYDCDINPKVPKSLLRPAMNQMKIKYFNNRNPAFDGSKNLYAGGTPLNFPNGNSVRDTVTIWDPERLTNKEFDITIKLVNDDLNLNRLIQYTKEGSSMNAPQEVSQAVDISIRGKLAESFIVAGRSFFSPPQGQVVDLGDGLVLWHGFFQSAIMAWKPYLNVDVANKAFPRHQPVLDYLKHDLQVGDEDLRYDLQDFVKRKLQKFIKGLKIQYNMPSNEAGNLIKRTYKVNGLARSAKQEKFKPSDTEREISVFEYYDRMKKYRIRYPDLPLLDVGGKHNLVPLELCEIIGNQVVMRKLDENQTSAMVRNAATSTTIRKERIISSINRARYNADPTLREFGIEIVENFETVNAIVFTPPQLEYKDKRTADVREGVWRSDNLHFIKSPGLTEWGILVTDQRDMRSVQNLESNLMQSGSRMGIPVARPRFTQLLRGRPTEENIVQQLREYARSPIQLVVIVMSNLPEIYSNIKRASELNTGVLTQCLKSRTLFKMNPMTAQNILLKINAKISGINHTLAPARRPQVLDEPVMIVGADVTHPAPGSEGVPSIAAVAASHDVIGFKYNMMYRLQASRMEMIVDLKEIIKSQLQFFYKQTGYKPHKILYFRDGVSEGQFLQILNIELQAIRGACTALQADYKPGITFVVVQKRHHTRFFPNPRDGDRKNNNVPAGTLVDAMITHPTELDFYLVSHQSIQGTARPTKYHLLWDDNEFDDEELERLTYYLCFMFTRCNRSVSYPAPTYYAHLAAFRARAYWDGQRVNLNNLPEEQKKGVIADNIISNYPMFFV